MKLLLPRLVAVSLVFATTANAADADLPRVRTVAALASDASLKTPGGRELEVLQYGRADVPYRFLVQGGLHGNEEVAPRFVTWLARRYARGESMLNLLPQDLVAFDFLPLANPDGANDASRYNARGVNLNRNFGVLWGVTRENPGAASFSEPETRAIRALFQTRKYTAAVDVHGYINWVVGPSSPEQIAMKTGALDRKRADAWRGWTAELRRNVALLRGYQLKTAGGLGDGGAFEDWGFWSEGTYAFCLELETFQRFVGAHRPDFADITKESKHRVDLFARYEAFIYRMFEGALRLKQTEGAAPVEHLAGN